MVKKVLVLNSEVSSLVFDEIAFGYCEKRDFKDLLSFFVLPTSSCQQCTLTHLHYKSFFFLNRHGH